MVVAEGAADYYIVVEEANVVVAAEGEEGEDSLQMGTKHSQAAGDCMIRAAAGGCRRARNKKAVVTHTRLVVEEVASNQAQYWTTADYSRVEEEVVEGEEYVHGERMVVQTNILGNFRGAGWDAVEQVNIVEEQEWQVEECIGYKRMIEIVGMDGAEARNWTEQEAIVADNRKEWVFGLVMEQILIAYNELNHKQKGLVYVMGVAQTRTVLFGETLMEQSLKNSGAEQNQRTRLAGYIGVPGTLAGA